MILVCPSIVPTQSTAVIAFAASFLLFAVRHRGGKRVMGPAYVPNCRLSPRRHGRHRAPERVRQLTRCKGADRQFGSVKPRQEKGLDRFCSVDNAHSTTPA
jgi:hypothetical protein